MLRKNNLLRVFGPALVSVSDGKICILGKIFAKGDRAVIHRMRSYAIMALEDSILDVNLGPGASIQEPAPGEEPIPEWLNVAKNIIENKYTKVMVLGPVDSCKSSMAVLIANTALNNGISPVAIIDADVGQADIGPPGFISLSVMEASVIWMRELSPTSMRFIGDVRPQYYIDKIISSIQSLARESMERYGCRFIVIDTDGWIQDTHAIEYKYKMISEIRPDALVVLGKEYYNIFSRFEKLGIRVYGVMTPNVVKTRSRDERRRLRSEQYKKFLEEAPLRKYFFDKLFITGMPLFEGEEMDKASVEKVLGQQVIYATRLPDSIHIVVPPTTKSIQVNKVREAYGIAKIKYYIQGFERGIYVSLTDSEGRDYPGMVESINFAERTITIRTMFDKVPVAIKFSKIRLTRDYTEQIIE